MTALIETKALPWLTERRSDLLFLALVTVGIYMGVLTWTS